VQMQHTPMSAVVQETLLIVFVPSVLFVKNVPAIRMTSPTRSNPNPVLLACETIENDSAICFIYYYSSILFATPLVKTIHTPNTRRRMVVVYVPSPSARDLDALCVIHMPMTAHVVETMIGMTAPMNNDGLVVYTK
jgi:hypothetical protein